MTRNFLTAAVAVTALVATPAFGQPGRGQGAANANPNANANANANVNATGGPSGAALDARLNSMGPANASPTGIENASPNSVLNTDTTVTPTDNGRVRSQGQMNASPTGISNANENSVLATGAVPSTALPGLETGLTVQTSTGTTLGTVSQVVTGSDGSIRLVIVTSPDGEMIRLVPNTLSISGGVVTTTSVDVGG